MAPIVYAKWASAPCRSVLVTAKALGVEVEIKNVDMWGKQEHKSEAYLNMNPAHTIPTLDDDGFIIWESRAIMTYLVEKYGNNDSFYPKDIQKRARVDNMLYFDIGNLHKSAVDYYFPLFEGEEPNPKKIEAIKERLAMLDVILSKNRFVAGDSVTVADISIITTLESLTILGIGFDEFKHIVDWIAKFKEQLPFYEEYVKEGIVTLKSFLEMRFETARAARKNQKSLADKGVGSAD